MFVTVFKKQFLPPKRPPTAQPNWMVSKKFLATKMSIPQQEASIQIETASWRHSRRNKKLQQQLFHLQSALGLFMYWKTFFALIRFEGTLRCQDSSPNQAPVSRFTNIRATSHGGMSTKTLEKIPCKSAVLSLPKGFGNQSRRECPRKQLFFCQKSLCKSVQKAILSLPKGAPHVTAKLDGFQEIWGHQNVNSAVGNFNSN